MNTGDTFALISEEAAPPCIPSPGSLTSARRSDVWSCGGGTQSVAIAVLICQGRLPKPEVAVIADTGREKETTWTYYNAVLRPRLAEVGVELHRVTAAEWGNEKRTGYFYGPKDIPLVPGFTNQTAGVRGKLQNFCTDAWKINVMDRWLSATYGLTPSKRRKWVGLSVDEPRRWLPKIDDPEIYLPLISTVPMKRDDCTRLIAAAGWPPAPQSSCYMCPNRHHDEWREMRDNHPADFARAVLVDRQLRETDPFIYLHEQCVPLDEVDFDKPATIHERACNSGECFL